jgi:DNA-binding CsgD family transcriptional regulator
MNIEALAILKEGTMHNQAGISVEEQTEPMKGDLTMLVASRKSPGIVILNGLGEVLHLNDAACEILTIIRNHDVIPKQDMIPRAVMDLCQELEGGLRKRDAGWSNWKPETTRLMTTVEGVILLRAFLLEEMKDMSGQGRRFLIMLEDIAERGEGNKAGKERFCLTDREWQVIQALTQGSTNKEIGNALRIAEPTVKSHIKHIMQKMKCTTRTAIVSQLVGSMACGSA